jgi:hypothetical protein
MSLVTAFITENGNPLRRAYVEHTGPFGIGSLGFTLTDSNGSFTFEAGAFASEIDIRIHAQNTVVRALHGAEFNRPLSINKHVKNGDRINIIASADHWDHFRILNIMQEIYDKVWRQFAPYENRGDYPLGKKNTVRESFASNTRIELSFPDQFNPDPNSHNWVEPAGASNDMNSLMHIRDINPQLFSSPTNAWGVLSHEAGHAMHFSALPPAKRVEIEARYLGYIATHLGHSDHGLNIPTDSFIAYIEAIGIFSERFFFYNLFIEPTLTGRELRRSFTRDELGLQRMRADGSGNIPNFRPVAQANANSFTPLITGNNKEGAVYGAIFLDFGKRIGLKSVVNYVLASGATTFAEFRSHVIGKNVAEHTAAINAVSATWGM